MTTFLQQRCAVRVERQALRCREHNKAADVALDETVRRLRSAWLRATERLDRQLALLRRGGVEAERGGVPAAGRAVPGSDCPPPVTAPVSVAPRARSAPLGMQRVRSEPRAPTRWTLRRTTPMVTDDPPAETTCTMPGRRCRHFPCTVPKLYHPLGLAGDNGAAGDNRAAMGDNRAVSAPAYASAGGALLAEVEARSVRRPLCSRARRADERERALYKVIGEMKRRSELNKPKDWCVNYGKSTLRSRLRTGARPLTATLTSRSRWEGRGEAGNAPDTGQRRDGDVIGKLTLTFEPYRADKLTTMHDAKFTVDNAITKMNLSWSVKRGKWLIKRVARMNDHQYRWWPVNTIGPIVMPISYVRVPFDPRLTRGHRRVRWLRRNVVM